MLALAMQLVVATKAGLVNYVQGTTNVKPTQLVQVAKPILTGPNGFVEVLLTPGSYLRVANNSEVVLDNVELTNVSLHVVQGSANVEVVDIDSNYPIQVTTGELHIQVADPGIYRFADGHATVLEGKIQTTNPTMVYKKGWDIWYSANYRARKVSDVELTALDEFSKQRSERIAAANMALAPTVQNSGFNNGTPYWIYSPSAGLYTFMPLYNRRSPYGFNYRGIGPVYTSVSRGNSSNSNQERTNNSNIMGSAANNNSAGAGSSGGGSFNSGGERTIAPPSGERVTPREYQERKAPVAGATVPNP
jgi:hypothetical protein